MLPLHRFFLWLEDYATRHQHTIALVEAFSTTMAVTIALVTTRAAKRAAQPRLKARFVQAGHENRDTGLMLSKGLDGPSVPWLTPIYVALVLTNVGKIPIYVGSDLFAWESFPTYWMVTPLDARGHPRGGGVLVGKQEYPVSISPGAQAIIILSTIDEFKDDIAKFMETRQFGRRALVRLLHGTVVTQDGSRFKAPLSRALRQECWVIARKPQHANSHAG